MKKKKLTTMKGVGSRVGVLLVFFLAGTRLDAQNYRGLGIGAKLGDPSGINLKLYQGRTAIDLLVGTAGWFWTGWWGYRDSWLIRRIEGRYPGRIDHVDALFVSRTLLIQGIFLPVLYPLDVPSLSGLYLEAGIGGELHFRRVEYEVGIDSDRDGDTEYHDWGTIPDIDLGPVGEVGIDWDLRPYDVPISVSLDLVVFMEIFDVPFGLFYASPVLGIRLLLE